MTNAAGADSERKIIAILKVLSESSEPLSSITVAATRAAFKAGLCVSDRVAVVSEGEKIGDVVVPDGKIGLATVCSIVVNGVVLLGSLNPVAAAVEAGIEVENFAESGMMDFHKLVSFREL